MSNYKKINVIQRGVNGEHYSTGGMGNASESDIIRRSRRGRGRKA